MGSCHGTLQPDGTCLVTLALGTAPWGIAVDATSVYWTDRGSSNTPGSVNKVPLDGGPVTTLASGQNYPWGIAVDATSVYWTNSGNGAVMKTPIDGTGSGPFTTLATGQSVPTDIAVDATRVYWINAGTGTNGKVISAPKDGSGSPPYTQLATNQVSPIAMVIDTVWFHSLYWINSDGTIKRVPLNGGTVTTLVSGQHPAGISVIGGYVYWTDKIAGDVKMTPGNGNGTGGVATWSPAGTTPLGLAVDATGNTYVCDQGTTADFFQDGVVRHNGAPLVTGQYNPRSVALDATSVYWTNAGGGGTGVIAVMKLSPR